MGPSEHSDALPLHDGVQPRRHGDASVALPKPTAGYRRRAWIAFQQALDPLAPLKPLRQPRV